MITELNPSMDAKILSADIYAKQTKTLKNKTKAKKKY